MCSDLECGICYLVFNAGLRCPRRLRCGHIFCETCLQHLVRPQNQNSMTETDPGQTIVCPMCRYITSIPGLRGVRAALRVDECVLEQLVKTGDLFLDPEDEDQDQDQSHEESETRSSSEDEESSVGPSRGRIRKSWIRVWKKICGKSTQRGRTDMTNDDLRDFALMASYMF